MERRWTAGLECDQDNHGARDETGLSPRPVPESTEVGQMTPVLNSEQKQHEQTSNQVNRDSQSPVSTAGLTKVPCFDESC